jgi:hypothetical protein
VSSITEYSTLGEETGVIEMGPWRSSRGAHLIEEGYLSKGGFFDLLLLRRYDRSL